MVHGKGLSTELSKQPPHFSAYYDDNERLPTPLKKGYDYQPDLISEKLVAAQQYIHEHYKTSEERVEQALETAFAIEDSAVRVYKWLRTDGVDIAPRLGIVAGMSFLTENANRSRNLFARIAITASGATLTTLILFPGLCRGLSSWTKRRLESEGTPVLFKRIHCGFGSAYSKIIGTGLALWSFADSVGQKTNDTKERFVSIFQRKG